eukprot:TRINITY_DN481_c0_g1_i1.p1 TRINITY_DN481_c0_g1~~TRINITY_DN481_c0_g1_i1.p1  ORF type:complete len:387 (+),score=135.81 TRINITY_DN481_c0_g1_i1:82-1242(+)
MNKLLFGLVCLAASVQGQCPVNENRAYVGADGCCVCHQGYMNSTAGEACAACAEGYFMDGAGRCSNGRAGSECSAGKDFPYFGCSGKEGQYGSCTSGAGGRTEFPCVCRDQTGQVADCGEVIASRKECYPSGPRMFTTFPNEPTVEKKFSLTLIGCGNNADDEYVVIPAYYNDNVQNETSCEKMGAKFPEISDECRFTNGVDEPVVALGWGEGTSANASAVCKKGVFLSGWRENNGGANRGMSEVTFSGITMMETGEETEPETFYRLCKKTVLPGKDGETVWQEVANHNSGVTERDYTFKLGRGPFGTTSDGECCEGLKIGSLCMSLWVFLLLWLLMALCLGVLGYSLHKNKNEIEAKKNNQKYEKFDVDAEMNDLAAKEADDDDI